MNKVCSICDSVNRSTAFFCYVCGSRLLTTIPPAVALAGKQDSPSLPPFPSEPAEGSAEIEPIYEAEEIDDEEITEIHDKNQESQEAQKAEPNEAPALSERLEVKAEASKPDIADSTAISSDELGSLSDESTPVALEAYDTEKSLTDLPPSVASEEEDQDNYEEAAAPTKEAAAPTEEAAAPTEEAAAPTEEAAAPTEEAAAPNEEPAMPAFEPVAPTEEPVAPTKEPAAPNEEAAAPTKEPAAPNEEAAAPTEEAAAPTEEAAAPTEEPTAPTEEPATPPFEAEEPAAPLAIEAESVSKALGRKEIDTDELVIAPSAVSFKKKTTGSSQERQNTSILALPPELESKERAVNDVKQEVEEDKQPESPPAASSETADALRASPTEGHLSAFPSGTLIAERFETIELLESDGQTNLYSVYDRVACPSCGSTENQPDDNYCWECGFDFSRGHEFVTCELREALSDHELDGYHGERIVHNQRFYLRQEEETSLAAPASTQPVQSPPEPQSITLSVGYQSDTGMVRQLNEDSLSVFLLTGLYESLSKPSLGLFIVADGMGGHAGGEIASKFVVQAITDRLVRRVLLDRFNIDHSPREEAIKPRVEEAVRYANEQLHRLAQERYSDMGSTVTLALVVDHRAVIANVGDSRVYIRRNGQLQQITKDHSVVASLIAAGMAQPHEIYTHPERNVVYRSMGNRATVEIDIWEEDVTSGDQLLLCSDGLWEAIHNEGIEEVLLTYPDAQAATEEMVRRANLAGGEDNITVILAEVG